jgi:hypothetical protein
MHTHHKNPRKSSYLTLISHLYKPRLERERDKYNRGAVSWALLAFPQREQIFQGSKKLCVSVSSGSCTPLTCGWKPNGELLGSCLPSGPLLGWYWKFGFGTKSFILKSLKIRFLKKESTPWCQWLISCLVSGWGERQKHRAPEGKGLWQCLTPLATWPFRNTIWASKQVR